MGLNQNDGLNELNEITDVTFDHEGAHLALTHKSQGGAANGWNQSLVMKSVDSIPVDVIKALQQVNLKISMEEFLRKFFNLYYEDAELLTKLLGFQTEIDYWEEVHIQSKNDPQKKCMGYLDEKLESIEIMKSVYQGEDFYSLPVNQIVDILNLQAQFEKSAESLELTFDEEGQVNKAKDSVISDSNNNQGDIVDIQEIMKSSEAQEIMKAAIEQAVNEAVAPIQSELTKAREQLNVFETEKAERRKAAYEGFAKAMTFIEEGSKESFVGLLMKASSVINAEDMAQVIESFEKAQKVIESTKEEFVKTSYRDVGFEEKESAPVIIDQASKMAKDFEIHYSGKKFL